MFRLFVCSLLLLHLFAFYRLLNLYLVSWSSSSCKRLHTSGTFLAKTHPGHSRSRLLALSWMSFLSPHVSMCCQTLRTSLSLDYITHYLVSHHLRRRIRTLPKPLLACVISYAPFISISMSDVVPIAIVKALPLSCVTVDFRPLTSLCTFRIS